MDILRKIKIHWMTIAIFGGWCWMEHSLSLLLPFSAAILHETGHLLVMKLCHVKIRKITVYPFGADIQMEHQMIPYRKEIWIDCAGLLVNALVFCGCMTYLAFFQYSPALLFFTFCNGLLFLLNILPIKTLDGGKILENLFLLFFPLSTVEKIIKISSFIFLFLLWVFGVYLFLYTGYNVSLFLMCISLFSTIFLPAR